MPLIRNRVTEKDLRDYLTDQGYFGRSAKVHELELAAIARPGWLQVFHCHLEAKHENDGWREFFGVIRDDERVTCEVKLFDTPEQRDAQLARWSDGLIAAKDASRSPVIMMLTGLVVVALTGLAAVRLMT